MVSGDSYGQVVAGGLVAALAAAGTGDDVEAVARPLLTALQELTGLESTYLTAIDLRGDVQRILYSRNEGGLSIPEGLEVVWSDTLCRRALESGQVCTSDVPDLWGDSEAAQQLGIRTYASSAVWLPDGTLFGTLCGASGERLEIAGDTPALLSAFSRLIADAVAREREALALRTRAEAAEARLRSQTQFLAVAEHKLKTPLTTILGWARTLLTRELPEPQRMAGLTAIERKARELATSVEDMLRQAESEVLSSELRIGPVDVGAVASMVLEDVEVLSDRHYPEITVKGGPFALADEQALRIVLEHLIENAVKYSPAGGVVNCTIESLDDGHVLLAVRDEGTGIPVGLDVFAPFTRGDTTTTGSGLGLHIVQSLVHAMHGEVAVSRWEHGSEFRILLEPAGSTA